MSSQPWIWDAATNQYAWNPEIAALSGHHPNTPSRPEENSRSAHGVPYSQGPPAPGPTASNLRDTQADMPNVIYPPNCKSSSGFNLECLYLSTYQHLRTGLRQITMALQSHPLRHHRGAYYPKRIPRSITMVLLLFPASQQG